MESVGVLNSPKALLDAVRRLGFLPFFKNEIPGFSIAEHTPPELWFSDEREGPWEWKGPVARTGEGANSGILAALDKKTGEVVWEFKTHVYSWSSPVDVYDSKGNGYILYPTAGGYFYVLDGKTGEKLYDLDLGGNVEASCAVFNDMVVVGHRLQKIFGIKLS